MKRYGYIDKQGCLKIDYVKENKELLNNAERQHEEHIISVDEPIKRLEAKGYKLLEDVDESQMYRDDQEHYLYVPVPYDKDSTIGYQYEKRFDFHKVQLKIEDLKLKLSKSDIKIIKFYEASLTEPNLSSSEVQKLADERKGLREEIRELENLLQTERDKQAQKLGFRANKLIMKKTM